MAHEKRQAVRLTCDLPVRLEGSSGIIDATLVDISRTGLRLRIQGELLGVHRLSSLVQISRKLKDLLGDTFGGQIDPEVLGPLMRKRLVATRIAKRDWQRTDVEIGCTFKSPLTDQEVGMLSLPLPAIGEPMPEEPPPVESLSLPPPEPEPAPAHPEPAHAHHEPVALHAVPGEMTGEPEVDKDYQAFLYPEPGRPGRPLVTRTRLLSNGTAILQVEPLQQWELADLPVTELVFALDEAYGTDIMLRIIDDGRDLWAGPAVIEDVDVTPDPAGIRIGVTFRRTLRTEELGRLGLPTPA